MIGTTMYTVNNVATRLCVGILCCMSATFVNADIVTINFDELPGMENVPGTLVPGPSQLSDQLLAVTGARFSSDSDYDAVADHSPFPTPSLPNVIGGTTTNGELSYGTPVVVTFFDPANNSVPAITDFVEIRGDLELISDATATLGAFDINGQLIDSVTANESAGGIVLSISANGIHSIRVSQDSSGGGPFDGTIGLDDLRFEMVAAIPEPNSLAIFAFSVGLLLIRTRSNRVGHRDLA